MVGSAMGRRRMLDTAPILRCDRFPLSGMARVAVIVRRPSHGERSEDEEPAGGVGSLQVAAGHLQGHRYAVQLFVGEPFVRRKSARLDRRTAAASRSGAERS